MRKMKRASGILMHISSLPSDYGIGDFGKEAYKFVDFLVKGKQKYWQILPLGVTGFGDSPYQCFSAFAGNPYFIDIDELIEKGYITEEKVKSLPLTREENKVDYGLLYINKMDILRISYKNAKEELKEELEMFYKKNNYWLREFALFMSLKASNDGVSWLEWEDEFKDANSKAVKEFENRNQDEIYFWVFTQYFFFLQWEKLKEYANKNNVYIIGDLPIYVSQDSSDVWKSPELFYLDNHLSPVTVSGCPPDGFSPTGQLWGNPIYNWQKMEDDGYKWWIKRIRSSFQIYDVLRIDHFRGFEAYWEVPYGSEDAVNGQWTKGPGIKLFNKIKEELGELDIIAEDLGFITDGVIELIEDTGFPRMKMLQFAFDVNGDSDFLPHNYDKNSIVYTASHDSSNVMGWVKDISKEELDYATKYLHLKDDEPMNWGFIRGAWSSAADLAVAPIQDLLGLGHEARMNTPSTVGGNWCYRIGKDDLTDELAEKIGEMTNIYRR